jgi:hypothetical protein
LVFGDADPQCVQFFEARNLLVERIKSSNVEVNLVLEAPLSVCFSANGNPKGRSIERENKRTRYWYVGLGCAVMVASMYIVRAIADAEPSVPVRLFEGFVSYKERGVKSDHALDVGSLRKVVKNPIASSSWIIPADKLRIDEDDKLLCAFGVLGLECGIPAVIKGNVEA